MGYSGAAGHARPLSSTLPERHGSLNAAGSAAVSTTTTAGDARMA